MIGLSSSNRIEATIAQAGIREDVCALVNWHLFGKQCGIPPSVTDVSRTFTHSMQILGETQLLHTFLSSMFLAGTNHLKMSDEELCLRLGVSDTEQELPDVFGIKATVANRSIYNG